jgi:uncharacterized membrane protein
VKRIATAVVGGGLTLFGVILLVLPGPGFVLIAAGLALLAREFRWAKRPLDYAMGKARDGLDQVSRSWFFATVDALTGLVLIAAGVVDLVVGLPVMEIVSDVTVIASGLFLIGTVIYARRIRPRAPG